MVCYYLERLKAGYPPSLLHQGTLAILGKPIWAICPTTTNIALGTIHILRQHQRGEGGRPNAYFC